MKFINSYFFSARTLVYRVDHYSLFIKVNVVNTEIFISLLQKHWGCSCKMRKTLLFNSSIDPCTENFMTGYRIVFDRERLVLGWKKFDCECCLHWSAHFFSSYFQVFKDFKFVTFTCKVWALIEELVYLDWKSQPKW